MKKIIKIVIAVLICIAVFLGVSTLLKTDKNVEKIVKTEDKPLLEGEAVELVKEKYEKTVDLFLHLSDFEYISDLDNPQIIIEKDDRSEMYY